MRGARFVFMLSLNLIAGKNLKTNSANIFYIKFKAFYKLDFFLQLIFQ